MLLKKAKLYLEFMKLHILYANLVQISKKINEMLL
jgi:hypothetical protein